MVAIQTVHMYGSADRKPFYKVSMTIVKCVKDNERVLKQGLALIQSSLPLTYLLNINMLNIIKIGWCHTK